LKDADPQLPEELTDRQQDVLEPLLAIADQAGGAWPKAVRAAAIKVFGSSAAADQNIAVQLLSDIRDIFDDSQEDRITSEELVEKLRAIESSPWSDWDHGKGISKGKLARQLHKFEIGPRKIRIAERTIQGYTKELFEDAWSRYLPATPLRRCFENGTVEQPASLLTETHFLNRNTNPPVPLQKIASNQHEHSIVPDVPLSNPLLEGVDAKKAGITTLSSCPVCGSYAVDPRTNPVHCLTCELKRNGMVH
jgi:hypothetical protein